MRVKQQANASVLKKIKLKAGFSYFPNMRDISSLVREVILRIFSLSTTKFELTNENLSGFRNYTVFKFSIQP